MSIQTAGSLQSILGRAGTNDWVQKADLKINDKNLNSIGDLSFDSTNSKKSFSEILASSLGEVNKLQGDANIAIQKLASGESKNIHETMIAVEQAEIAFKTMNQVRSKVLDAYKQIMSMQI